MYDLPYHNFQNRAAGQQICRMSQAACLRDCSCQRERRQRPVRRPALRTMPEAVRCIGFQYPRTPMALPEQFTRMTGLPVLCMAAREFLLYVREFYLSTISSAEAFIGNRHFFTFQSGRNSSDNDYCVHIFHFLGKRVKLGKVPFGKAESQRQNLIAFGVIYLNVVGLSFDNRECCGRCGGSEPSESSCRFCSATVFPFTVNLKVSLPTRE